MISTRSTESAPRSLRCLSAVISAAARRAGWWPMHVVHGRSSTRSRGVHPDLPEGQVQGADGERPARRRVHAGPRRRPRCRGRRRRSDASGAAWRSGPTAVRVAEAAQLLVQHDPARGSAASLRPRRRQNRSNAQSTSAKYDAKYSNPTPLRSRDDVDLVVDCPLRTLLGRYAAGSRKLNAVRARWQATRGEYRSGRPGRCWCRKPTGDERTRFSLAAPAAADPPVEVLHVQAVRVGEPVELVDIDAFIASMPSGPPAPSG